MYTCGRATKGLVQLIHLLGNERLLQAQPDDGYVHQWLRRCDPCRKGDGPKRCLGWQLTVERGFLAFGPISTAGKPTMRLDISARCGFQRDKPGRQGQWCARPMAHSNVVVEVFDVADETLLERHHIDLANRGQAGPTWHFQYGGNAEGGLPDLTTSWLQEPRWPIAPVDMTLLIELLVYNFFPEQWLKLNGQGEWLQLMWDAEQLVVSHFAQHMARHFEKDVSTRDRTWLAAQDNADFDPRPS